jgi:hypothetical protein
MQDVEALVNSVDEEVWGWDGLFRIDEELLEMALLMFSFTMQTRITTSQGNMSEQQTILYFFKEVAILSHSHYSMYISMKK